MNFLTVVHIAGVPSETQQRCVRCHKVLIDAEGSMTLDGLGLRPWPEGGYVGMIEGAGTILMSRDAREDDEINCKEATIH